MDSKIAIYEQCPWDENHVNDIYPVLNGAVINDGNWHDIAIHNFKYARYRVFDEKYFQALYSDSDSLVAKLFRLSPVQNDDDAEWTIVEIEEGYFLTSIFTTTPHVSGYGPVDIWLSEYELGFEPHADGLQGVAYFDQIETECLADAMDRLVWLENTIIALNQTYEEVCAKFWKNLRSSPVSYRSEENKAGQLPAVYQRQGRKLRQKSAEGDQA